MVHYKVREGKDESDSHVSGWALGRWAKAPLYEEHSMGSRCGSRMQSTGRGHSQAESSRHLDLGSGAQEETGLGVVAQGHGHSESNEKPENE